MNRLWELETKRRQAVILIQKVTLLDDGIRSTVAYHFCPAASEEGFDEWTTLRYSDLSSLVTATDHKGKRLAHREIVLQVKSWDG